jgi:peptidoglycan/LPS O-acetylase OafA/YrhL
VLFHGWVGVDLFFVLSGFLITRILVETREDPRYFRQFFIRRALRIFPLYYGVLAVLFLIVPWVLKLRHEYMSHSLRYLYLHQEWYWTYTVNVLQGLKPVASDRAWAGHFWTRAIEEQFYLFWPLVVWLVPPNRLSRVCVGLILSAFIGRLALGATGHVFFAYVMTPTRMDSLAAGALIAVLWRTSAGAAVVKRYYPVVGLGAGAVALAAHVESGTTISMTMVSVGLTANAVGAAALVAALVDANRWVGWLSSRPLRFLGRLSYGAYVYHLPIITLLSPIRERLHAAGSTSPVADLAMHAVWILIVFVATLIVAMLSYRVIEQPILALKERWAPSNAEARVVVPPGPILVASRLGPMSAATAEVSDVTQG